MKNMSLTKKILLQILGFLLGFVVAAMGLFTVLFMLKVIPHGGI